MSDLDPTVFPDNRKVRKADLREQVEIAHDEITALQHRTAIPRQAAFGFEDDGFSVPPFPDLSGLDLSNSLVTSTSSNTPRTLADRFAQVWNVQDYGVIADGVADDTAALQLMLDTVPSGTKIVVTKPGAIMMITDTLTLSDKEDVWITSETDARNFSTSPVFIWNGANNGVVLALDRCRTCHVEGFNWRTTGGVTVDKFIDIDGYSSGHISTQNVVRYNAFNASNQLNSAAKLVSISATAANNNENMDVIDNTFVVSSGTRPAAGGIGIYVGASSNAKHHRFNNNGILQATTGIELNNGSCEIRHLGGGVNKTDIVIVNATEPIHIANLDTESSGRAVDFGAASGELILDYCRFDNSQQLNTGGFLKVDGCTIVRGCNFEASPPVGGFAFEDAASGNLTLTVHDTKFQNGWTYTQTGIKAITDAIFGAFTTKSVLVWNVTGVTAMPSRYAFQFSGVDPGTNDPVGWFFGAPIRVNPMTMDQLTVSLNAVPTNGTIAVVTDSKTNFVGGIVVGGGSNKVLAWYDNAHWVVVGRPAVSGVRTVAAASDTLTDADVNIICNFAGTVTLTLPDAALYPNRVIRIKTITANAVQSASTNVIPQDGSGGPGQPILAATAGKWADIVAKNSDWEIMASG